MFLPLNETELSEAGSFLNGLLGVFGVRHSLIGLRIIIFQVYNTLTLISAREEE